MAAWLLGSTLAVGLAAACPPPGRAAAPPASATTAVTDALTGRPDAASLAPEPVCPPPSPGRATCYAQALAARADGSYVHPRLQPPASPVRFFGSTPTPAAAFAPAVVGAGEPQPGTPAYLQQAYDLAYLSETQGGGDTVGVVDAYDDSNAEADLSAYRSRFGLPPCTTANGCFRKVNQTGQTGSYPSGDSQWAVEISLDLDAVSALCPQCHIVLVEANTPYTPDLLTAQATAAQLGAEQISDSWGSVQSPAPAGTFTFAGVATVAAAGDQGYVGAGQSQYPAALAGVTAAGGTTLTPASGSARGYSESAWSGAGSGCDTTQSKPAWQTDSGCAGRSYADLSADADPGTGMDIYDSGDGGWLVVGGTSEASPLIAAYYALTGAQAQTPAWAYQHAAQLNDPASGSNGSCQAAILYICNAGAGYDGPTGMGSISGAVVAGGPGIGGPGPSRSSATTAQVQGGVYPNGGDTTWWVQYGTTTAYGQQTAPAEIGSGTAPVAVAASLTGLDAGTQYHYRLVAQNGYGTTYGYDLTLTTAGPPAPAIGATSAAVSSRSATLTASVDPGGAPTSVRFQYGTTIALGQGSTQAISGTGPVPVSASLSGLTPRTTYFYQLFAANAGGAATSPILSFTTGAAAPPPAAHAAAAGSGQATVRIVAATLRGGRAAVALACRASSPCRARVRLTVNGRTVARTMVSILARRTRTVRLSLGRRAAALARAHRGATRVTVLELLRGGYRVVASGRPTGPA